MELAMSDWAQGDHMAIGIHAPLALEHLAKAALWRTSPILLVPLEAKHETSLLLLATKPDLAATELRTIGLASALARLGRLPIGPIPVDSGRRRRLVDLRNGSMHVAETDARTAKHVLTDIVLIMNWLLDALDLDHASFYGRGLSEVGQVMSQFHSEVEEQVARKLAAAARHYQSLKDGVSDPEVWNAMLSQWQARNLVEWDRMSETATIAMPMNCVVCDNAAALVGPAEVDVDADVEGEHGEIAIHPIVTVQVTPLYFRCDICRFGIWGPDELDAAGITRERRTLNHDELRSFDPIAYTEMERAWLEELPAYEAYMREHLPDDFADDAPY
jgi:hypothetical protein